MAALISACPVSPHARASGEVPHMLAGEGFRTVDHAVLVVRAGAVLLETHCAPAQSHSTRRARAHVGSSGGTVAC